MTTITAVDVVDVRFPTSRSLDGSDAMNPDPDYSAAYVDRPHGRRRRPRGPRLDVHHRPRHGDRRCGRPCASAPRPRPVDRRAVRRHGRLLATAGRRQPAALDRPGEGRHPPRDGGGRQRRLGPVREDRRQAALEARRRHDARGDRRAGRLPLHHRRPAAGAGPRSTARARPQPRASERPSSGGTGYPAYTTSVGWLGYDDDKIRRALPRSARGRLDALQVEGRCGRRGRPPARADRARGDRP